MMVFRDKRFVMVFDDPPMPPIQGMELEGCVFDNCGLSINATVSARTLVRGVRLRDCAVINCDVGPAIFEDLTVDNLKTNDLLIVWGAAFKQCTFRGRIGKLKINKSASPTWSESILKEFQAANRAYYSNVDWALDISDAAFQEFEIEGMPADLVRRDPSCQVVVRRENALSTSWRNGISRFNSYWPFVIDMFIESGEADCILVAPKAKPKKQYMKLLDGLKELRDLGVAEQD
jgi:hypothetical protein